MPSPWPAILSDVDIDDWAGVSPEQLMTNPGLVRVRPHVNVAGRVLKYSRSGETQAYDEIGFRARAATPSSGPVPLQTLPSMRLEREWKQLTRLEDDGEKAKAQQRRLRHRPLELPDDTFRYEIQEGGLMHLVRSQVDARGRNHEEVWTFPLTRPPASIMDASIADDVSQLVTQSYPMELPGGFWLPLTALIGAGAFERMQTCRERLVRRTVPGCFYAFLSHRWLSPTAPDPDGRQARYAAWQLVAHLCEAIRVAVRRGLHEPRRVNRQVGFPVGVSGSELAESLLVNVLRPALDGTTLKAAAREVQTLELLATDYGVAAAQADPGLSKLAAALVERPALAALVDRVYVWYDYSCLPQPPRSEGDEALFLDGLEHLVGFQILGRTAVMLDDVEGYLSRAWCTMEAVLADAEMGAVDLLVGSERKEARTGVVESYFRAALQDRPHIVWRAVLDTEVFGVQTPLQCMARLSLAATDERDVPTIYERLRTLPAPAKVHVDASELVTGVFPLALAVGGTAVVVPRHGDRSVVSDLQRGAPTTLDWTQSRRVKAAWEPGAGRLVDPLLRVADHGCHVAVVASCEGEASLWGSWVLARLASLERIVQAPVATLSWLASDIAPVGHFSCATLIAAPVRASLWVVVTTGTRLTHCAVTTTVVASLAHARMPFVELRLDEAQDNVVRVNPPANPPTDDEQDGFETIALEDLTPRLHVGGLLRSALLRELP